MHFKKSEYDLEKLDEEAVSVSSKSESDEERSYLKKTIISWYSIYDDVKEKIHKKIEQKRLSK